MLLTWNVLSLLSCPEYVVHESVLASRHQDCYQARTQDFLKGGSKIEMKRKVTKMLLSLQKSINSDCVGLNGYISQVSCFLGPSST